MYHWWYARSAKVILFKIQFRELFGCDQTGHFRLFLGCKCVIQSDLIVQRKIKRSWLWDYLKFYCLTITRIPKIFFAWNPVSRQIMGLKTNSEIYQNFWILGNFSGHRAFTRNLSPSVRYRADKSNSRF